MILTPKNWASFQHYKDRAPPWIKLHKDLLDDSAFQRLPIASRALAPMLWLLASESKDGAFDGSAEELAFRLRTTEAEIKEGLGPLISKGFFLVTQDDIKTLADCKHNAIPEGEAEGEAKTEAEKKPRKRDSAPASPDRPDDVSEQVWADWLQLRKKKSAPVTATVLSEAAKEADKAGLPLERFLAIWCARGSQGLQAEWLKPHEVGTGRPVSEPLWRTEQRQRTQQAAPGVAVGGAVQFFSDVEAKDVTPRRLG